MKRISILLAALLFGVVVNATAASKKLNVCLILADDWRADCMGLLGHDLVKTPNLDKLCADGFIFRNAYVLGGNRGAVCMPSRTMIQTGVSYMRKHISTPTLAQTVKAAGYASIRSGKAGNNPNHLDQVFDQHHTPKRAEEHAGNIIGFIKEHAGKKPLFLYFAPEEPHTPCYAPKEYYTHYNAADIPMPPNFMPMHPFDNGEMLVADEQSVKWPRTPEIVGKRLARYYASIEYMDAQAGRIIEALKKAGQFDNTIFVVAGDNGMALGSHGLMGKQNLYELGGMHVPLLFAGPGVPKGDTQAFAYLYDIYPTMCQLAGIPVPAGLDAKSLVPVIQGKQPKLHDLLFSAYIDVQRSIRDERWKLTRYPLINKTQLFDLKNDPYELTDLSANPEYAGKISELSDALETTRKGFGDTDPITVENPNPAEWSVPAVIPKWADIERDRNKAKAAAKAAAKSAEKAVPALKAVRPSASLVEVESASAVKGFEKLPLPEASGRAVTTNKKTVNEKVATLVDGQLGVGYGPVFGNGVKNGAYKMDLGKVQQVAAITSWSYNEGGRRGAQKIVLYGSNSESDPGWDLTKFTPLGIIDTGAAKASYTAASLRGLEGESLGQFRWIIWSVSMISDLGGGENTSFQELAVELGVNKMPATVVAKPVVDNSPRIWGKKLDADWVESLTERGHPLDAGIAGSKKEDSLKYIGMPAGGIGCGSVYLGGDGQLWVWDIFNQMHEGIVSQNAPLTPELEAIVGRPGNLTERHGANYVSPPSPQTFPNAFEQGFGVKVGSKFRRFEAKDWADVEFEGNWPMGTVRYSDPEVPVEVTLNGYSPFIPLNLKDSSLPVTVMEFTLKNTSKQSVEADVIGWLENAASIHTRKLMPVQLTTVRTEEAGMKLLTHSSSATPESLVEAKRPDIVFETFEGAGYGKWKIEGKAFGNAPTKKDAVSKYMKVQGESMALSSDVETGTLTSPPFVIQRKTIQFFLAGGKKPGSLCLNLLVDPSSSGEFDATRAKIVASEAGLNRGALAQCSFNVSLLQGKKAQIQIVDNERGKQIRGYIAVDQIVFADGQDDQVVIKEALDYGTISLGALSADAKATDHEGVPGWGNGLQLAPGESKTVTFMLTWNFPEIYEIPGMKQQTHEYASRFADSAAVAEYVAGNYPRLRDDTRAWVRSWYDSTLPVWFLDRTLLTADTLQTANVYLFEDGQFWGWEGIGSCAGTCTHVYQYAQAFARLFPSLERSVREGWNYTNQHEDGVMGHRSWDHLLAVDGQAGVVLSTYREHLMSADDAFLRRVWPNTKRAIDVLIRLDAKDGKNDGIIEEDQHNTLDAAWSGPVAWISGEYQAALRATEEMALVIGDEAFAKTCHGLYESGREYIVKNLYDGEYFFNIPDPDKPVRGNSVKGCHIDQVYGQGWAFQVGLGRTLPEKKVHSALNAIWKYNYVEDVGEFRKANRGGRWYAMPGESGLVMCTFPRDEKPRQGAYLAENMTGFEYQVAGHMLYEGTPELIGKGLAITRSIHDRYSAPKRNPYNEIECSDHYARAAASYGAFLGACGFKYNGPKGEIGFAPRLTPEDFRAAFTSAEGWGSFAQKVVNGRQSAEIDLHYGTLELKQLSLGQVQGTKASGVSVKINGKPVAVTFALEGGTYALSFDTSIRLKAGQCLEVDFK